MLNQLRKFDPVISLSVLFLTLYAVIIMLSLTGFYIGREYFMWIAAGVLIFIMIQYVPVKIHFASSYILFIFNILVIIVFMLLRRYAESLYMGFASEFLKLTYTLALARFLLNRREYINSARVFLPVIIITAVLCLIYLHIKIPSGALILYMIMLVLFFLCSMKMENMVISLIPAWSFIIYGFPPIWVIFTMIAAVILYILRSGIMKIILAVLISVIAGILSIPIWQLLTQWTGGVREYFTANTVDVNGYGWNLLQSRIATGSGGLFGKGLFQGTQKGLDMIQGQDDIYIFSVIGEELGFMGYLMLMFALIAVLMRVMTLLKHIRIAYSRFIALTLIVLVFLHFILNISISIGIVPLWECSMPLFSFNPPLILIFMICLGIVNKICVTKFEYW